MIKIKDLSYSVMLRAIKRTLANTNLRDVDLTECNEHGDRYSTVALAFKANYNTYVVSMRQHHETATADMHLFRKDVDGRVNYFTSRTSTVASFTRKVHPTKTVIEMIDDLCPKQLDLFDDPNDVKLFDEIEYCAQFGHMKHSSTPISLYGEFEIVESTKMDDIHIDIFYKSENTTIRNQACKILMFVVTNENRDDVYAACYPRVYDDLAFKQLMSHYRNQRHGTFMKLIVEHSRGLKCALSKVDPEIRDRAAICLTQPRSPEGIYDSGFQPMRAYAVLSVVDSMDGKYLALANDDGQEVERRPNHFVPVPRRYMRRAV